MTRTLRHGRLNDLSLRAKFKGGNSVEVAIVDHATGETFMFHLEFRPEMKIARESKAKSLVEKEESDND